jgi:hypothetical protein
MWLWGQATSTAPLPRYIFCAWREQRSLLSWHEVTDILSMDVRGGLVTKDDSAAPKPLALPKEEQGPKDQALCPVCSHTASVRPGSSLCCILMWGAFGFFHQIIQVERVKRKSPVITWCKAESILYSKINSPKRKLKKEFVWFFLSKNKVKEH